VDGTLGSDVAQRWAVDEARARKLPLELVCSYTWSINVGNIDLYSTEPGASMREVRAKADQVMKTSLQQIAAIAEEVEVVGSVIEGNPIDVLLAACENAALLVVGSRQLHATGSFLLGSVGTAVAARATCPVVVTRGPAGYPAERSQVVVGVDASPEAEIVLGFAFDEASRHRAPLHAVMCWHPTLLSAPRWLSRPGARAREEAEVRLAEALAGWQEKYPDVAVTSTVVDDHAGYGLVSASVSQYLLVVGQRGRRAAVASALGSVSQSVLHHAVCPVAVVPLD
jgi:nucleotide-binding universal stress UspA family protein